MGKKGQLLFKGDKRPKKKSKKSKAEKQIRATTVEDPKSFSKSDVSQAPRTSASSAAALTPSIQTGTGKITTSGTVVTGHSTKFQAELDVGDAVLVNEEMRVVTMRLSNTSVNLSSAFSTNLRQPTKFQYVKKPKNQKAEQDQRNQKLREEANALEKNAFDIYGSGTSKVFTYREKTETGSYRVKQQAVSSSSATSRTDLLALRSKKTSDKYC